jgi:SAM-dependent methyltransferase
LTEFTDRYADLYDTLYADKDYEAEAAYMAARIRNVLPAAASVLEFGSGTGRHARLLAAHGFDVTGVERSPAMLARAERVPSQGVRFIEGDMRSCRVDGLFDCVIALFHVVSYLLANADILDAFHNARRHLAPGGLFLFDFWYGPAVLTQKPETRVKEVKSATAHILRVAQTSLRPNNNLAQVNYSIFFKLPDQILYERHDEIHTMRYFFLCEISTLLTAMDFELTFAEESGTGRPLDTSTWGAMVLAQAV